MNYRDIKGYLEGKTTPAESEQIRNWLINPENDVELRQILGEIWANSEIRLKGRAPDFNRMLDQVHHQITISKFISLIQCLYLQSFIWYFRKLQLF